MADEYQDQLRGLVDGQLNLPQSNMSPSYLAGHLQGTLQRTALESASVVSGGGSCEGEWPEHVFGSPLYLFLFEVAVGFLAWVIWAPIAAFRAWPSTLSVGDVVGAVLPILIWTVVALVGGKLLQVACLQLLNNADYFLGDCSKWLGLREAFWLRTAGAATGLAFWAGTSALAAHLMDGSWTNETWIMVPPAIWLTGWAWYLGAVLSLALVRLIKGKS